MKNLSAAHRTYIRFGQRQDRNRFPLGRDKLNLECPTVGVPVHHCPHVTPLQATLRDIVREDDRV